MSTGFVIQRASYELFWCQTKDISVYVALIICCVRGNKLQVFVCLIMHSNLFLISAPDILLLHSCN